MKVTLYANTSVNGKILLNEFKNHQIPEDIFALTLKDIVKSGNLIIGKNTFSMSGSESLSVMLPNVKLVTLSQTDNSTDQLHVANGPIQAINFLKEKGYENICIGGGTKTYNTFLKTNLVTDIIINIFPIITEGGDWFAPDELNLKFKLISNKIIDENIIQLKYSLK